MGLLVSVLVERLLCTQEVKGSSPLRSTNYWVVVLMVERVAVNHYVGGSSPSFPANAFIAG